MSVTLVILILIVVILAVAGVILFVVYNRLTIQKNRYENAFAQIDVQLKRRYDLIPNLVNSARAYLAHESETLEAVIAARNIASGALKGAQGPAVSPAALQNLSAADLSLGGALGRLMAVMENYPNLKADKTIADLSEELKSTENRISFARQAYNDSVMQFNQSCEIFPNVLFSGFFGFHKAKLWEIASPQEAEPVKVNF
ncbi:MAG: LemA family protein [Deltaproteobacteria bacterium]|nr:LemA family protein [Deltaproteobacteria bacterium]